MNPLVIPLILMLVAPGNNAQNGVKVYDQQALKQLQNNMVTQDNPANFLTPENEELARRAFGCDQCKEEPLKCPAENKISCHIFGGGKKRGEKYYSDPEGGKRKYYPSGNHFNKGTHQRTIKRR